MTDKTGCEMEAMVGCSIAALTVYDMCKSLDKKIVINEMKLISKSGGKSGDFKNTWINYKISIRNISKKYINNWNPHNG